MRLIDAIEVYAGGPGSGCHGDNCGRPKTKMHDLGYKQAVGNIRTVFEEKAKLLRRAAETKDPVNAKADIDMFKHWVNEFARPSGYKPKTEAEEGFMKAYENAKAKLAAVVQVLNFKEPDKAANKFENWLKNVYEQRRVMYHNKYKK